jgi:hypothetical protein
MSRRCLRRCNGCSGEGDGIGAARRVVVVAVVYSTGSGGFASDLSAGGVLFEAGTPRIAPRQRRHVLTKQRHLGTKTAASLLSLLGSLGPG